MHNVLEAVVVETGRPHLAAAQAVLVALHMARLRLEVAQTRSALRLGQGHRAPKSTLDQWSHVRLLLLWRAVGFDQVRGAVRQRIKAAQARGKAAGNDRVDRRRSRQGEPEAAVLHIGAEQREAALALRVQEGSRFVGDGDRARRRVPGRLVRVRDGVGGSVLGDQCFGRVEHGAERFAVAGLRREGGLLPEQELDVAPVEDRAAVAVGIACGRRQGATRGDGARRSCNAYAQE